MNQQMTSFTHLLSKMRSEEIYVIEDLHTGYMSVYGGGYLANSSTIEFIKRLVTKSVFLISYNIFYSVHS
jgi:hypothetical protein